MCGAARTPPDTKSSGTQRAMDLFNAARSGGKAKAARSGRSGGSWRSTTVGRPSVEIPSGALPHGNRDRPGHSALKRFHPALCVGNEIAASLAVEAKRPFAYVLSTVSPLDVATLEATPSLSSTVLRFPDKTGAEKDKDVVLARKMILDGARDLHRGLATVPKDGRALVHCAWGQNRSVAICVAWAVIYKNWTPQDAIRYARDQCDLQRTYRHRRPLHNERFVEILRSLVPSETGAVARKPTALSSWLSATTPNSPKGASPGAKKRKDDADADADNAQENGKRAKTTTA